MSLPPLSPQEAAFLACAAIVGPPLVLVWFEEHILRRPRRELFED